MTVEVPVKIKLTGVPELDAGLQKVAGSFDLTKMAVEGLMGAFAGAVVIEKAAEFLTEAHAAAQQSRTSMTLLTQTLGYYSAALDDQNESLSKSLFIQKNELQQADQRLLVYTHEESSIRSLIPGIADLAKVKGIDLVSASNNVGLALKRADESAAGHIITIRGLGIAFKATGTQAGNVAAIEDALKKSVGGSSKAVVDSLDGWSKLGFWSKEVTDNIGKMIFGLSKDENEYNRYQEAVKNTARYQKMLNDQLDPKNRGKFASMPVETLKNELARYHDIIVSYEAKTAQDKKKADDRFAGEQHDKVIEENDKLQKELETLDLNEKKKALIRERDAAIKSGEDRLLVERVYADKISKVNKEIKDKNKPQKGEIKEEDLPVYLQDKFIKAQWEKVNNTINWDVENEKLDKSEKKDEETMQGHFNRVNKVTEEQELYQQKYTDKMYDLKLGLIKNKLTKEELLIKTSHQKERNEALKAQSLGLISQQQYSDEVILIDADEKSAISHMNQQAQEDALSQTTKNLQSLASKHKEWLDVYKAAAIGQAVIDTYKSAESVYAGFATIPVVGPELGIAGAAIAVAAGLANVQQIANAKTANYGGVVGGGTYDKDTEHYLLSKGEIVYNPLHPNPRLAAMITNSNTTNGGDTHHYHISMPITVHGNPTNTQIAQIGEVSHKALFKAITKAQNMGKLTSPGMKIRA